MLLIKPYFKILTPKIVIAGMLGRIEAAGRTCYKSEDRITEDSAKKFVKMIVARGHETVIEHELMSVRVVCDRGVTHELVRHRIATFSQESTRYCDYSGELQFVIPPWLDLPEQCLDKVMIPTPVSGAELVWLHCVGDSERHYRQLRERGWKPEEARSILPNSLKAEIVMTANLREWRHFFKLRTASAAHPQMREIARPMLDELKQLIPVIFDDIYYDN